MGRSRTYKRFISKKPKSRLVVTKLLELGDLVTIKSNKDDILLDINRKNVQDSALVGIIIAKEDYKLRSWSEPTTGYHIISAGGIYFLAGALLCREQSYETRERLL